MNSFKGENDKKKRKKSAKELHRGFSSFKGGDISFYQGRWIGKRMAPCETEGDVKIFEFCFNRF